MNEIKDKINELENKLKVYAQEYYTNDNPSISDIEYDKLYHSLRLLLEEYPQFLSNDSITRTIGYDILDKFEKANHQYQMYSLDNAFNEEDLLNFENKINKENLSCNYILEPKIDGLAISLTYEDGVLVQALTRGDGQVGENVTNNVKTIQSIPIKLKDKINLVVRGEVYLKRSNFVLLNENQQANNEPLFVNARNAAAGTLRQLDSAKVAKRKLDAFFYTIANYQEVEVNSQQEALTFLKKQGFSVNDQIVELDNLNNVMNNIKEIESKRPLNDYDIDGCVLKVNQFMIQEQLGFNAKAPKFAIAYKFEAVQVETKLLDIFFSVGRTGQVNPNAVLESVFIDGSNVSRATLHNIEYIQQKDIRINDQVIVRKAGDIIPEVVASIASKRDGSQIEFKMIDQCPICHSQLEKIDNSVDYYCVNLECPAKNIESIIHFASRKAMNIMGLGDRIVEVFYNEGFLKKISDIYILEQYQDEIVNKEGFGHKSYTKLVEGIATSKQRNFDRLLFGLGIRHLGDKSAKLIVNKYPSIDLLMQASFDDLIKIEEIGPKIAQSIIDYFSNETNVQLVNDLKAAGLKMEAVVVEKQDTSYFSNKAIVLTGSLTNFKRDELASVLEAKGARVTGSVSKNTDLLIYGDKAGSKLDKALKLEVSTMDENSLIEIFEKE